MKVLNLCCGNDHGFEGWFASEADFLAQSERGAIICPVCASPVINRLPTAPRLNLSGAREPMSTESAAAHRADGAQSAGARPTAPAAELQALWFKAVQQVLANTEDVGERFSEEARRIHYGETGQRGIRGQANEQQRAELADEGIEVMAFRVPEGLKGPTH